ncbi:MAG: gliding motility-associated C-terminal domain-containing protein, partial [Bacteroidales bacterium]|nr:gliding motility-associated C-terminal domain-containing protein [Bacteroidales bacterium]
SGPAISGLVAGSYIVTVEDGHECTAIATVQIIEPSAIQLFVSTNPATCGGLGGSAIASVMGGTPMYQYAWSSGGASNNIQNIAPGDYTLLVTDANSCTISQTVYVDHVGNINASINVLNQISCPGESDGIIQAFSSNGYAPFYFDWSNDSTTSMLTDLPMGAYQVMITDNWGCIGTASVVLVEPMPIVITGTVQNVRCYEESNGRVDIDVTGGTEPFIYIWSYPSVTDSLVNVPAGNYTVTVYDQGGCRMIDTFNVAQPDELVLNDMVNNISCFGNNDGAIMMSATGGNSQYQYTMYAGDAVLSGASHYPLPAGAYYLAVRDNLGCSDSTSVIISEPAPLDASYYYSNPSCIGNSDGYVEINVSGGTAPYLFGWDEYVIDIPLISGLIEGSYDIMITDANGCQFDFSTIILTDVDIDCLIIPNAFTPNGDGPNDTWVIENLDLFPGAYVYVYNRWGQELYTGRPGDEWDGQYNGKFVPAGTYLYVIELYNGTKPYTGTVTVVY